MSRPLLTATRIARARRTVERTARETVPALSDFCLVHVRLGPVLKGIAGAHATVRGTRDVHALMRAQRILVDDHESTAARVVRTGRHVLRPHILPDPGERRNGDRAAALLRRLAPRSVLVVPIAAGPTVLGAMSLCFADSGRFYGARDLPPARKVARRIADALAPPAPTHAALGIRATARDAGEGTTARRRVAARS